MDYMVQKPTILYLDVFPRQYIQGMKAAGVAPCYRDAYPCLTVKDEKGRILAVLADDGFSLKGMLPGAPAAHTAKFRLGRFGAPKLPEGTFDVFLSVGEANGTPIYELPLGEDDGHRRYKIGIISLDGNR